MKNNEQEPFSPMSTSGFAELLADGVVDVYEIPEDEREGYEAYVADISNPENWFDRDQLLNTPRPYLPPCALPEVEPIPSNVYQLRPRS